MSGQSGRGVIIRLRPDPRVSLGLAPVFGIRPEERTSPRSALPHPIARATASLQSLDDVEIGRSVASAHFPFGRERQAITVAQANWRLRRVFPEIAAAPLVEAAGVAETAVAYGSDELRNERVLSENERVIARPPSPSAQFSVFLSRFPPEIVALVKRCLPKLRRAFPGSNQLVYEYSNSLVVAFGMSERGYEAIVAIAIFPRRVRLYFDKSLPDPKGLLEGSGAKVRSVTLAAASDLDHGDIQTLIKAAIKRSGFTVERTRTTRMVIMSESKKRKPRRTGHA